MKRCVLLLVLCVTALSSAAQLYPSRPIRLIVPFPAGGPADSVGRVFAEPFAKALGQPVIIENRAGASGSVGAEFVARSAPDGYTLLVQNMTDQAAFPFTFKRLEFDPIAGFQPITQIAVSPMIVVAHPSLPASSMAELVAYARANPGKVNIASFGQGSVAHLGIELLMKLTSIQVNHIPYRGGAPAIADTVAGHVPVAVVGLPVAIPLVRQGRLRALAVTTAARAPQLPDVPSVAETEGLASYDLGIMYGLLAPAHTPPAVISRLHASAVQVLRTPELTAKIADLGLGPPIANTPEEMAAATRKDVGTLGALVKAAGIAPE